MALIDTIRAQYPTPRRAYDDRGTTDSYCIGGGLCMYAGITDIDGDLPHFPETHKIAEALTRLNPGIHWEFAMEIASQIVYDNDSGHFEDGWKAAGQALTQNDKD